MLKLSSHDGKCSRRPALEWEIKKKDEMEKKEDWPFDEDKMWEICLA